MIYTSDFKRWKVNFFRAACVFVQQLSSSMKHASFCLCSLRRLFTVHFSPVCLVSARPVRPYRRVTSGWVRIGETFSIAYGFSSCLLHDYWLWTVWAWFSFLFLWGKFFCSHAAQVAGGGGSSNHGQVEIFSLNRATPRLVKILPLRSAVLCLEYVKEPCLSTVEKDANKPQSPAKIGNIICVGLQDGRLARLTTTFVSLRSIWTD